MGVNDLTVSMILRMVDRTAGPARAVIGRMGQVGAAIERTSRTTQSWAVRNAAALQAQQGAVLGAAAGTAGLVAAIGASLRPAVQFESAMANVGAVARTNDEQLAALTATARELGATTRFSASQAASGMQFLAMAGFETNEVIAAMPGMLNLAAASASDLGTTADISSNILSGFNLEATEMARVGDVLTHTFTSSNVNLRMLGEAMKFAAPIASATGVSLEQTAAMAGLLGDAGIQGSMAGTALRAVLNRLSAPTAEAAKQLRSLGIETADAEGNLRDLPTILAELDKAMEQMGSAQQNSIVKSIFGEEASASALVLLGQAGSGALQEFAAGIEASGGAATRVAQQMNATTGGALTRIRSQLEAVAITIGTVMLPGLVELLDVLSPVLTAINQFASNNPELVKAIGMITAAAVGLRVAALVVRGALVFLGAPILKAIGWIAGLTAAIVGWPAVLAAALAAAAVAVIANWDAVEAALRAGLEGLQGLAKDLVAWVASIIPDWLKDAWDWMRGGGGTTSSSLQLDSRPALPPGSAAAAGGSVTVGDIHVHPAPGMDEQRLAERTAEAVHNPPGAARRRPQPIHDGADYAD